jgi:hypothetical protein
MGGDEDDRPLGIVRCESGVNLYLDIPDWSRKFRTLETSSLSAALSGPISPLAPVPIMGDESGYDIRVILLSKRFILATLATAFWNRRAISVGMTSETFIANAPAGSK